MEITPPPAGVPVNRWRTAKQLGKVGLKGGAIGAQAAQFATGTSSLAIVAAGAAASATGIGLVVTGAVFTLGNSVFSAISAHKSRHHRNNLQAIYDRAGAYACQPIDLDESDIKHHREHHQVRDEVLPYVIEQKNKKYHRKVVGAVPGVGLLETVRAVGKKAYKAATGTLGVERKHAAGWIATHLISYNCGLVQSIVAELFSFEEMLWIMEQDCPTIVGLVEDKLKST